MTDLYEAGRQYRQAGDLARAEAAFREALSREPARAEIWLALGSLARQQGNLAEALAALQKAAELDPQSAEAFNLLGIVWQESGHAAEAANAFERAIEINPASAVAHNNLANVYLALGRQADALAHYEQAVRVHPQFAEAHGNLGNVLRELGRLDEALESCRRAVQIKPTFAIGHNHLGAVYSALRRWEEAAASFRQALELNPRYPEAQTNLSDVLRELGRLREAEAAAREAVRLRPQTAQTHVSLGMAQMEGGRLEAAEASIREALRLDPASNAGYQALGMICMLSGRREEAVTQYRQSVAVAPDDAAAHRNLAISLLLLGQYDEGWREYRWRWKCPEAPQRNFSQPQWDGSPLGGQTVLVHAEQGIGDTLQFVRYAALAKERGGRVVLGCQRALMPLLRRAQGVDELVALGDPLPYFDVHAPLMDLPGILGMIPAQVPYVDTEAVLVERWRKELASLPGFKVGIAWQGSPAFRLDRHRSIPLAEFAPLAAVPGVTLVSLQKGFGSEQIAELHGRFKVVDFGERLDESGAFLDTAAIIKNLDLVIASDTATPHLAGALGVPVWLATPFAPDWRWLAERDDSPWYPTMRLFRQSRRGEWQDVFRNMAAALAGQLGARLPVPPVMVEVPAGELIDKITILEIKAERIDDAAKLNNVHAELETLSAARDRDLPCSDELDRLTAKLREVNGSLWEIEDELRVLERRQDFGPKFVELARSVYWQNDRRARVKRQINDLLGSRLVEEKSYQNYQDASAGKKKPRLPS